MKKYFIVIILTAFASLTAQINLVNIKMGHTYTVSVPDDMVKTYDFGNHQILQYKNDAKEIYLVILEESKDEFKARGIACNNAEDYYEIMTGDYKNNYLNYHEIKNETTQANGNTIIQTEYEYTISDSTGQANLYFFQDYVDTGKYFYKVVFWTRSENTDLYRETATAISKTIKAD